MHCKIKSMENYSLLSKNMDLFREDIPENLEDKKNSYMDLISSMLDMYKVEGKITYDPGDSRNNVKNKSMKKFKEMDIYEDLKLTREINHEEYLDGVKKEMMMMMNDESTPRSMKTMFKKEDKKIIEGLSKSLSKEEKIRKSLNLKKFKIPKVFKFPLMDMPPDKEKMLFTPMLINHEHETDDGTLFLTNNLQEDNMDNYEYLEEGIGINKEEDETIFDELYEFMVKSSNNLEDEVINFCPQLSGSSFYEEFKRTNMWYILSFLASLAENICYMEGRRHMFDKKKGHTVMKAFGNYILLVRAGSKLTSNKQIKYKLMTKKDFITYTDSYIFHSWKEFNSEFMETRWLTMSITDLAHFVKIREVSMAMASDYYDKKVEMIKSEKFVDSILDKSFVCSIMVLMEHKRGTSTSLQLNRYLLHSASSYITNREKLVEDINSNPIRSRLESFIRIKQMNWYEYMLGQYDSLNYEKIEKMMTTDTDYDRVYFPSFFDLNLKMEFGMMMNEMYLCNLFNKESGFVDHRIKQIVSKMTTAELHYQKIKTSEWSKGNINNFREFWMEKDTLHTFDKRFVASATKKYFGSISNQTMMMDAMLDAFMEIIDPAMMMTSSLTGGKYKSSVLDFKEKVVKTKSFLSLYELLEEMPTHLLIQLVSMEEIVEAIFTIFPKSQIGGPREILIQSVMLRVMVKFLETISFKMCEKHDKEMITKDKKKSEIQSQQMSNLKESMMTLKKKGVPSIMASFNSDATKWAPGFVMEHFLHFVFNWETDDRLKDFLCTVICSFTNKVILTPDLLKDKWEKKPDNQVEYDSSVEAFREMNKNSEGAPIQEGGMGQGMFHKLSSAYHAVIDDTVDSFLEEILFKMNSATLTQTTLISSDDKTKMFLMVFGNLNQADEAMKNYIKVVDFTYRLSNIHTNWKKSGLQFIITEFNSLFSIGKRMSWATVKDLYTANSIPDLTSPEEAVKFMLSSIRRCFEHGVYLPTIKALMYLARNQLIRYYKYSNTLMKELCDVLETSSENLPYQLGFIPTDKVIETLVFGLDFHMFKENNSERMMDFYKGLYSANCDYSSRRSRHYIPFDETGSGKFWMELPMRLDKKLIEMKNDFYKNTLKMEQEDIIKSLNLSSMNVNFSSQDFLHHKRFKESYFIGMNRKYEFQETMVVHSLVRALQMTRKKAIVYPLDKEQSERQDIMNNPNLPTKEREIAYEDFKLTTVGVLEFVFFCMSRKDKESSLTMMEDLKKMNSISNSVHKELKEMVKSVRMNHPTMRELRFNMEDYKSSFNKNDMMNYLFDRGSDFRNSSMKAFEKMCKIFDVEQHKVWINPFKFMRSIMSDKDYCYKTFSEFMDFMSKMSHNISMRMLSDFPDSGNMKVNLMNLYRSRTSSLFLLDYPRNVTPLKEDVQFLTKMSFRDWIPHPKKEKIKISMEDRRVTRARKLCSMGLNKDVKMKNFECDRLFYKKETSDGTTMHVWTDLSFLAIAEEFKEKGELKIKISIKSISKNSIEDNNNFISVKRYLMDNSGKTIIFLDKHVESKDGMILYSVMPDNMYMRMDTQYYTMKYNLKMTVYVKSFYKGKNNNITFYIMEDNYSFSSSSINSIFLELPGVYKETLKEAIINPPEIEILDQILIRNGWIQRLLLEKEVDPTDEMLRLSDISSINKQFSAEGVLDMLPKLMSLNLDDMPSLEPLDDTSALENVDVMNMYSMLGESLRKSLMSDDLEVKESGLEVQDTMSIMMMVEKVVKTSVHTFLNMDNKRVKDMIKLSEDKMDKFHNMMIWCLKDTFPMLSDTMILMIYNIKLKEMSFHTYINQIKNLKLTDPSYNTKENLRSRPIFFKIEEKTREEIINILDDF
uniref:RNA-directed RNA polymerase L n=1 Tax=Grapevine-associated mycobunya-like virus 4 TaxID=2814383 RepID=A0A8F5MKQ9_9VIRU|nr:MAG: RNA-dependent RNA polymerase [Grapevine-associated mycobunya-like virus 4]